MKKVIAILLFVGICIALTLIIARWIWSLDIPDWMKVLLISN